MAENQNLRVNIIGDSSSLNQALGKAEGRINKFSGNLTKIGKSLTTRLTLPLAAVGTMAVKQAANFEKLQTTLNVLTGSADAGAAAFERLVQFSAKTPFQLGDLVKVNNTLMGFGLTTDKAFNSLSMLGDVAGIVGGDLQSIAIAFGQAAAEGRVMTRDLRQFINNGVPILQVLSEEMGVAEGVIMDMASEGKITFELLDRAFRNATAEGGKFEGGMETLSQTLNGLFSTLKDNVNIALAELGQEIADALNLKEGIPALSKGIGELVTGFKSLNDDTQKIIITIGLLAVAIPPLTIAIGALITSVTSISTFLLALNPIVIAVTLSATAFAGAMAKISSETGVGFFETLKNGFNSLGNPIAFAALQAKSLRKELQRIKDSKDVSEDFVGPLLPGQKRVNMQDTLFPNAKGGKSASIKNAVSETIPEFNGLSESATKLHQSIFGFIESAGTGINTVVRPALSSLSPIITTTQSAFQDLGKSVKANTKVIVDGAQVASAFLQGFANSITSAFSNSDNSFRSFAASMLDIIGNLIIQMGMAAIAASELAKTFAIPGVGLVAGLAAVALGAVIKGIAGTIRGGGLQGMAKGGIAFGQTPVMVGDYSGVRSNPEVIAPLNKLKAMIGGGSQNVTGEFVLRGQDLVVALQRAEKSRNRIL